MYSYDKLFVRHLSTTSKHCETGNSYPIDTESVRARSERARFPHNLIDPIVP